MDCQEVGVWRPLVFVCVNAVFYVTVDSGNDIYPEGLNKYKHKPNFNFESIKISS